MGINPSVASAFSSVLLYFLILGLAGTVDPRKICSQFSRGKALLVGLGCQFLLLPFIGCMTCFIFAANDHPFGIALMIVMASPGGSFSNLWCFIGNADLALSVAMTTVSTLLAIGFLPLNVWVYLQLLYGSDDTPIPLVPLVISLGVVIAAVVSGLLISYKVPRARKRLGQFGTLCGIGLLVLAVLTPSGNNRSLASIVSARLIGIVSVPCVLGFVMTLLIASFVPGISRPERSCLAVETCFQNTSIAIAVALQTPDAVEGIAIPLVYGVLEVVVIAVWMLIAWQIGWSYAPRTDPIWKVIVGNYQPMWVERAGSEPVGEIGVLAADVDDPSSGGFQLRIPAEEAPLPPSMVGRPDVDNLMNVPTGKALDELRLTSWGLHDNAMDDTTVRNLNCLEPYSSERDCSTLMSSFSCPVDAPKMVSACDTVELVIALQGQDNADEAASLAMPFEDQRMPGLRCGPDPDGDPKGDCTSVSTLASTTLQHSRSNPSYLDREVLS